MIITRYFQYQSQTNIATGDYNIERVDSVFYLVANINEPYFGQAGEISNSQQIT